MVIIVSKMSLNEEYISLVAEIERIVRQGEFNGVKVLEDSAEIKLEPFFSEIESRIKYYMEELDELLN